MTTPVTGCVRWLVDASASELEGYEQLQWAWLRELWVARLHEAGMQRPSLASPAQPWFERLATADRLAVTDVVVDGPGVLADLLGFVVEPAVRLQRDVVVVADVALDDLDDEAFVEPGFGYAYTLQRLRSLLGARRPRRVAPAALPDTGFAGDDKQCEAVNAGGGVVQVIAPAGSGKTTVLIERVRELCRRGVPAETIVCLTFNRKAKLELLERLKRQGVGGASALTFNGLGYRILREAGDRRKIGDPTLSQWRRLAALAKNAAGEDGVFLQPSEAQKHLSDIKLRSLLSPEEYAATITADSDGLSRTLAALYEGYELQQREDGRMDLDDQILLSLRLLGADPQARRQWQQRWECLLVDEYQDIEPAQELLVRILAAPDDQLFCVGDEDQTLYAFRRASVQRIICLDEHYPGLERIALGVNYRCPEAVVAASARLVAVNEIRFPKPITAFAGEQPATIALHPVTRRNDAAAAIAQTLASRHRGEIVVLARTTNALRPVALACADQGVKIDGPPRLFTPQGARLALRCHLELVVERASASPKTVKAVCQTPGRSIGGVDPSVIAAHLRAGASFHDAFADVKAPGRGGGKLLAPGELFTRLSDCERAQDAVGLLRTEGGLDDWFAESDRMGGTDRFECETLEEAQDEAAGLTLSAYLQRLRHQAEQLTLVRDETDGIELTTIHGSKGRQWPHVIVVSCDDGILPHARSLKVSDEDAARGEGIEAERRLAYVAFTRAREHLELHYNTSKPSQFLAEAGLLAAPAPPRSRPPRQPRPAPRRTGARRGRQSVYVDAVALTQAADAVPAAPDRVPAQPPARAASPARDRVPVRARHADTADLVAQRRMSRRMTIERLARELSLSLDDTAWLLRAVPKAGGRTKLRKLDVAQTNALARALRDLR